MGLAAGVWPWRLNASAKAIAQPNIRTGVLFIIRSGYEAMVVFPQELFRGESVSINALTPEPAAVNVEDGPVEIIRICRGEKNAAASDVVGFAPAAFGNTVKDGFAADGVIAQGLGIFRGDVARRNGVDVDA